MEAMTVLTDVVEIARILGISRQAASELTESAPDFPPPEATRAGRPTWARRQVEAWAASHPERGPAWRRPSTLRAEVPVLDLAGAQAHELGHGWIGDEHLLLALLHPDCPGAGRAALESFGLSLEALLPAVVESVGSSFPTGEHGALLSYGTQSVFERANLKAIELRDEQVSGEHMVLALLEAPAESRALVLLAAARVDRAALAERAIALSDRAHASPVAPEDASPLSDHIDAAEVARVFGVSRKRVLEIVISAPDFPGSELRADGHRVWPRSAIESWAATHPERGPERRKLRPPAPGGAARGTDHIFAVAKAEAKELNHTWVGRDHLFLALLHPDCPSQARAVLQSLGLTLEDVRRRWVESMGDPYEPHDRELLIGPATHAALEGAIRSAVELEDEEVTGAHMLLALTQDEEYPLPLLEVLPGVDPATLHSRLMAETDGMMPAPQPRPPRPSPWKSSKRIPRPPEPELALSPAGHDPRRRRPWGSCFFDVSPKPIPGKPWSPFDVQYPIDRDGYAVLTTDGRPLGYLQDEEGKLVLADDGKAIRVAVDPPEESTVSAR